MLSRVVLITRRLPNFVNSNPTLSIRDKYAYVRYVYKDNIGGYSGRVPPLPISNREVKTPSADGTASSTWKSRSLPIQYN
jgi:hypothetical protein